MKKLKMYRHDTNGLLITFCGLDGCGKSTMIRMLMEMLAVREADAFLTKQPTDFVRQTQIFRTYMDEPNHDAFDYRSLSLLAASDRLQHVNKVILPALEEGQIVVSDRYFYSCLANLRARGFEQDKWIYEISGSVIKPDLAFFLDVPVETAVERVRSRKEERDRYIDMDLQYRLRDEYLEIARRNNGIVLSTEGTEAQTFQKVYQKVSQLLEERNGYKRNY